nr:hypothetical protein [Bacilli bacterium]
MNYIYDVLVNFKYPLIEFYDWNIDDDILNIKRIPLSKISSEDLNILKYHKFKLNITAIKGITKVFNDRKKNYNSIIYTDGNEAIAFNFDDKGVCISKSDLLLDEERDILDNSISLDITNIEYKVMSKDNINQYRTRNEVEITKYLINEIDKIDDLDKLNYIYYECFNEHKNISKTKLINRIKGEWDDKYYKIYDFFKSISMNKN